MSHPARAEGLVNMMTEKDNNANVWEYNLFLLLLLHEMYVWVESDRENQRQLRCTHIGNSAVFLWNLSVFLLRFTQVEIFPGLYNFQDALTILVVTPPFSMPPTQFTWHFHQSYPSPLWHLCPVYFGKQAYFLWFFCF